MAFNLISCPLIKPPFLISFPTREYCFILLHKNFRLFTYTLYGFIFSKRWRKCSTNKGISSPAKAESALEKYLSDNTNLAPCFHSLLKIFIGCCNYTKIRVCESPTRSNSPSCKIVLLVHEEKAQSLHLKKSIGSFKLPQARLMRSCISTTPNNSDSINSDGIAAQFKKVGLFFGYLHELLEQKLNPCFAL